MLDVCICVWYLLDLRATKRREPQNDADSVLEAGVNLQIRSVIITPLGTLGAFGCPLGTLGGARVPFWGTLGAFGCLWEGLFFEVGFRVDFGACSKNGIWVCVPLKETRMVRRSGEINKVEKSGQEPQKTPQCSRHGGGYNM